MISFPAPRSVLSWCLWLGTCIIISVPYIPFHADKVTNDSVTLLYTILFMYAVYKKETHQISLTGLFFRLILRISLISIQCTSAIRSYLRQQKTDVLFSKNVGLQLTGYAVSNHVLHNFSISIEYKYNIYCLQKPVCNTSGVELV